MKHPTDEDLTLPRQAEIARWGPRCPRGPALIECARPQTFIGVGYIRGGQDNPGEMWIFAINITLDGCVDHTKQSVDEEKLEYFTHLTRGVDVQIFGRKTYQLMVPYWPDVLKGQSETKADTEFARAFVSTNKVVFSRSLDSVEDSNTRIVRGSLQDEILKLKQEQGKDILVGGVDISSQLIELGLVDEYRFVVGPVVAGEGDGCWKALACRRNCNSNLSRPRFLNQEVLRFVT